MNKISYFYDIQIEGAKLIKELVGEVSLEGEKPLNIRDIDWQLSSKGVIDDVAVYNLFRLGVSYQRVYRRVYIGISSSVEEADIEILGRLSSKLGIKSLKLGVLDMDSEDPHGIFNMCDLNLHVTNRVSGRIRFKNIEFDYVEGGRVLKADLTSALLILLYLIRPYLNIYFKNPYIQFGLAYIDDDMGFPDGLHIVDRDLKKVDYIGDMQYTLVKNKDQSYIEFVRDSPLLFRYKT